MMMNVNKYHAPIMCYLSVCFIEGIADTDLKISHLSIINKLVLVFKCHGSMGCIHQKIRFLSSKIRDESIFKYQIPINEC